MRELRLNGVHDDGEHLVVTDDTGEEYRLRIDDRLRAATRRDRPRLGQLEIEDDNVRPRDVQAMIRAGATADEVADRTGWDLDKVARFEGPVLAERGHVAELAQNVRLRGATQAEAQETLSQRAATRFASRDVDPSDVGWDACRNTDGQWTVTAVFVAGGRERSATWWFDVAGMSVVAKNDEAKWLSEADTPAGPVSSTVHRPTTVFDVEVEEDRAERANRPQPDDLIASMREHSGAKGRRRGARRKGRDTDEEALPFETEETPPAARGTHPEDARREQQAEQETGPDTGTATEQFPTDDHDRPGTGDSTDDSPAETDAPSTASATEDDSPAGGATDTSGEDAVEEEATRAPATKGGDTSAETPTDDSAAQEDGDTSTEAPTDDSATDETGAKGSGSEAKGAKKKSGSGKGRGRKGRASVPSWDDVMFGSKRE